MIEHIHKLLGNRILIVIDEPKRHPPTDAPDSGMYNRWVSFYAHCVTGLGFDINQAFLTLCLYIFGLEFTCSQIRWCWKGSAFDVCGFQTDGLNLRTYWMVLIFIFLICILKLVSYPFDPCRLGVVYV